MAAMVSTEATMDKWVMKLVNLQKLAPKIQSLESVNSFGILNLLKSQTLSKTIFIIYDKLCFSLDVLDSHIKLSSAGIALGRIS